MHRIREFNRRLNDRFFPRHRPRYVSRFRELTTTLSSGCTRVLHLGSGQVDLEPWLPQGPERPQLLALDVSLDALTRNRSRFRICADGECLPLPSACVDLIVAEHVFEHLPRPEACLRECLRILKRGGRLVISGPNGRSYIALAARLTPLRVHRWVRCEGTAFPTLYRFSTPRVMQRVANDVGFEMVGLETFVGEPCYTTFLPVVHYLLIGYHLLLERLRPWFNLHITSVALFRK
jgi:ubiquinone/menaquinone biosynthesis C-methylase UbiE